MKEETSTEELNLSGVEQHKQEMQFHMLQTVSSYCVTFRVSLGCDSQSQHSQGNTSPPTHIDVGRVDVVIAI